MNKDTKRREQTKRVGSPDTKKKGKKIKFKDKHPRIATTIKIGIIALILITIIGAGILVGAFFGVFGEELKISKEDLVIEYENSTVYDKNGNVIATLSGGTKRKIVSLSEMSEYLPKAFVAIEDERFYDHSGVDIKRTGKAVITYLVNGGESSFGGSTITQQLIKNITKEKDNTALAGAIRKVKEISKAIQVEQYLSKDQILELYLNMIFVGGNDINGVALGAVYYFNKDVKDLSIAESAYLAGINHMPNSYNPFNEFENKEDPVAEKQKVKERAEKRTKTVLAKMKELNYINEEQYAVAVKDIETGLKFERGEEASATTEISYHTEAALEQILEQIMADTDMNESMAEMHLYSSGLHIYTTQDTEIQNRLEEELADSKKYLKKSKYKDKKTGEMVEQTSMASMVIIDHNTGEVVASGAGIGEDRIKTKIGYFNIPTRLYKSTGSSMKPLAVIAPGIETGVITGSTVYYDADTKFGGGYHPHNYYQGYRGLMSIRQATEISANIPFVKALSNIGVDNSTEFCKEIGLPIAGDEGLSLGLGGLTHGVSVYQMAGAYSMIANGGVYKEPTFYTKVTDGDGNTLYEPKQEEKRVMTEQNAYIVKNILQQPVKGGSGTATYCAIKGMDVAAKTGTTNDDFDRWLCGFTPYYTAACWYGYEYNAQVIFSGNPAGKIWDAVMTDIHEELENASFVEPEGIKKVAICRESGKRSKEGCVNVYTEVFTEDLIPDVCDGHSKMVVCRDSGMLPTEFCPVHEERIFAYLPEKEQSPTWQSTLTTKNPDGTEVSLAVAPIDRCTMHTAPVGCTHDWGEWTVTNADEYVKFEMRICSKCGNQEHKETKLKDRPAAGHTHSWVKESEVPATCTADGSIKYKCSGCTETKTDKVTKKSHNYVSTGKTDSTCSAEGSESFKCSVCEHTKTEKIEKKPHTPSAPAANGEVKCSVCGEVLKAGSTTPPAENIISE